MAYRDVIMATSGLRAYYRLGEATGVVPMVDEKGTNTGAYAGTPVMAAAGALVGDANTSFQTGSGGWGYILTPTSALNLGSGPFTLEAWVDLMGVGPTNYRNILSKGSGAYAMWLNPDNTAAVHSSAVGELVRSTAPVRPTGWHHIVGTKTGPDAFMYVDGVDVTLLMGNPTMSNNSERFHIGAENAGGGSASFHFGGGIDEVALYNVVLTPQQVFDHFGASGRQQMLAFTTPPSTWFDVRTVGHRFTTVRGGDVSAIRYWHVGGDGAGTTHSFGIYNSGGTKVLTVDDACGGDKPTGWRLAYPSSPFTLAAASTYTVSWDANNWYFGYFSAGGFTSLASDLTAVGAYEVVGAHGFPNSVATSARFGLDVVFSPSAAPTGPPPRSYAIVI